jgi:murein DD-endopeptidase MepM/ murein hydrolase activator NlpD
MSLASSKSKLNAFVILLIAVVVIGGIGSYFVFYPQTGPTTRTTSVTSSLQTTSRSLVIYSMFGKIFFDYNGNGKQDPGEPDMSDVVIALDGKNTTSTNSTGWYLITSVVEGNHTIRPFPPARFRYMCESDSEFRTVKETYTVSVRNDTRKDIGLMEGFLTAPFNKGKSTIDPQGYVDLDPRSGHVRDWKGGDQTYDGHNGIDFIASKGTPILAGAPGRVFFAWNGWPNKPSWGDQNDSWKNGNSVIIYHENGFWTSYNHLDSIAVNETSWNGLGQLVKRGDVIGYCGYTGFLPDLVTPMTANQVHLHFQVTETKLNVGYDRDPFRDLYYGQYGFSRVSNPVSLWTVDNDPQFFV